jgi:parallel beta-helix repeat protein
VTLSGSPGAKIVAPPVMNTYTIAESSDVFAPIIFAYGGTLIGNYVDGPGIISVAVHGFDIDGRSTADSVGVLYRNIRPGCTSNSITCNTIQNLTRGIGIWNSTYILIQYNLIQDNDYGIQIAGCTYYITVYNNWILDNRYPRYYQTVGILVTGNEECEPTNIEIHSNYLDTYCSWDIGIWNQISITVNATLNWWGEGDGPGSPDYEDTYDAVTGRLADGYGEQVIGLIHFDPWAGIEANGTVYPTYGTPGDVIHFDASDSFGYGGHIGQEDCNPDNLNYVIDGSPMEIEYLWDFGDGYYSFQKTTAHIYNSPGTYHITLRINALNGYLDRCDGYRGGSGFLYDFAYFTVTISAPNSPLTANAAPPYFDEGYKGIKDCKIQFYGGASGGDPPYNFNWNFGDYTEASTLQNPIHIYHNPGNYTATLTVTDNNGDTATDTAMVSVYPPEKLIADAGGPYISSIDKPVLFKGSATGGAGEYRFVWDFGDGSPQVMAWNPAHIYQKEGNYTVTLIVTDNKGMSDEDTTKVTIFKEHEEPHIENIEGGFGVKATIHAGSEEINWSIAITGKLLFGNPSASGTIDAYGIQTVKTPFTLGFGKVEIIITAGSITEKRTAFMIGPYVWNIQ